MRFLVTLPLRGRNKTLSGVGWPSGISSAGGSKTGAIWALLMVKGAASARKMNKKRNSREGPMFREGERV